RANGVSRERGRTRSTADISLSSGEPWVFRASARGPNKQARQRDTTVKRFAEKKHLRTCVLFLCVCESAVVHCCSSLATRSRTARKRERSAQASRDTGAWSRSSGTRLRL
ncbi:unnamed protein product, partial [Ectocarpus sp. 12 AP-2014]